VVNKVISEDDSVHNYEVVAKKLGVHRKVTYEPEISLEQWALSAGYELARDTDVAESLGMLVASTKQGKGRLKQVIHRLAQTKRAHKEHQALVLSGAIPMIAVYSDLDFLRKTDRAYLRSRIRRMNAIAEQQK
jgi:hypothetical protein